MNEFQCGFDIAQCSDKPTFCPSCGVPTFVFFVYIKIDTCMTTMDLISITFEFNNVRPAERSVATKSPSSDVTVA